MTARLSYTVITPARDEAENLPRLAAGLAAQTVLPAAWVIVDNGSTDGTLELASELAREHSWVTVLTIEVEDTPTRAGPTVQAFQLGLASLGPRPDIVVKLDADVSFSPDYFARLLAPSRPTHSWGWRAGRATRRKNVVAAAARHGGPRLGSFACISTTVPGGRPAARVRTCVGRDRRAQGCCEGMADEDVATTAVLPPPAGSGT